eukprot:TRINITY_DN8244_c0_g1_i2.p1 TRINITY_DN8244_c0_g1~~TRINITY_DN8244_c0_g1_i2.p1  ORF type:complete len:105 (+),score=12.27 TRINITY_DN8244_c0_g1_i2:14-328(+)
MGSSKAEVRLCDFIIFRIIYVSCSIFKMMLLLKYEIPIMTLGCISYRQIHEWMARINPSAPGVSKWFEPWSIFCSDSVRFRLQQTLEPLAACPFLLSVDYEVDA